MPIRQAEITKPMPQWETPIDAYPLINHEGNDYQLIPIRIIEKLMSDRENLIWLCGGLAAMVAASLFALVSGAFRGETKLVTIEKPVIVTQEKIVPTNCLIFCK